MSSIWIVGDYDCGPYSIEFFDNKDEALKHYESIKHEHNTSFVAEIVALNRSFNRDTV